MSCQGRGRGAELCRSGYRLRRRPADRTLPPRVEPRAGRRTGDRQGIMGACGRSVRPMQRSGLFCHRQSAAPRGDGRMVFPRGSADGRLRRRIIGSRQSATWARRSDPARERHCLHRASEADAECRSRQGAATADPPVQAMQRAARRKLGWNRILEPSSLFSSRKAHSDSARRVDAQFDGRFSHNLRRRMLTMGGRRGFPLTSRRST